MICVYITDVGAWSEARAEELLHRLPPALAVPPTKDTAQRWHRIAVRTMLWRYVGDAPLLYDAHGAPCVDGSPWHISVSHDAGLCVLAVSDEGAIGVDIQQIARDSAREARLRERFLDRLPTEDPPILHGVRASFCNLLTESENNSLQIVPLSCAENDTFAVAEHFFLQWTRLEAVLKADGRGFAAFPEACELWPRMQVFSTVTEDMNGRRYVLSLAAPCHSETTPSFTE